MKKLTEVERRNAITLDFYKTLNRKLKQWIKPKKIAKQLKIDEPRLSRIINKQDYWLSHKSMEKYLDLLNLLK